MAGGEREKIMPSLIATSLSWRTHSAQTNFIDLLALTSILPLADGQLASPTDNWPLQKAGTYWSKIGNRNVLLRQETELLQHGNDDLLRHACIIKTTAKKNNDVNKWLWWYNEEIKQVDIFVWMGLAGAFVEH
jgi:hypothetical protein